ncbi:glycine betaine ABC transporter substrate-binding protein [Nodosilinea nodulosa]|uniref:glycine betaine ABC transporter substrate-binding protein n=1 Tax=Nodosilinea nodulosa TaxID=416001 RepID=UPI0002E1B064|nr:glycine betaine ABC transporter substrate-binding protein [Nodosilinea nodulosa]
MKLSRRWFNQACLGVATALVAAACGGGGSSNVVSVGSKDFTEQLIIGEMYALVLEENGFTVERKLNLGGTPVAQAAIESGDIDLYPEYTGTALLTVLKLPVSTDQKAVYDTVKQAYKDQFNLVWLDPSPMNNTQALAMTEEKATALDIRTISAFAAQASSLTLIGPPEFEVREDGLPGLKAAYGDFTLKSYKPVDAGLRYKGLVDGEADVAVAFGTDGEISAFNLVVLEDDKGVFPPYQIAPIVSQAALDANPGIAEALNQLSPLLNDEVMRQLNYEVSGKQREPAEVAQEFLVKAGLVTQ